MKNRMEVKFVNKNRFLVNCMFLFFFMGGLYAQTEMKIYFLINKNDTLIMKQKATQENKFEGYSIIDEQLVKPLNRTPLVKGKVWVPESIDDFHTFGPSFSLIRKNDIIITEDQLTKLNVIKSRKEFLEKLSSNLNFSDISYFFIEPKNCSSNYILRRVFPVIH